MIVTFKVYSHLITNYADFPRMKDSLTTGQSNNFVPTVTIPVLPRLHSLYSQTLKNWPTDNAE